MKANFGYFHGRFQPFHNGHLEVVKFALKNCDLLLLGISNPFRMDAKLPQEYSNDALESLLNARLSNNNPWPYWARVLMMREGIIQEKLDIKRIVFIPNLNNTGLPVNEIRFPKTFTKIFISPKEQHNLAILEKYRHENWTVLEVPIFYSNLSSRSIRESISKNQPWEHLVPKGTASVIKWLSKSSHLIEGD